eukprot:TRINITY_DN1060_c0_g1_i1.p1 TRINITY_DN1060_c0_g1~~TRINITY_DN1060_c0_g1_i1.p1  ORF type:complete len:374 (-),score=95.52 TRINITY_DN1060_c0_g1_i1:65-1186(-)
MVAFEFASRFMIIVLAIASVLQLCVTMWMTLGLLSLVGIRVKKGIQKDLLWVQLVLFAVGFVCFLWTLICEIVGIDLQTNAEFCVTVQMQITSFLIGLFNTIFMFFLFLKLRAIRLNGKVTFPERLSLALTVLTFILTVLNAAVVKGKVVPRFETGLVCIGTGNTLTSTPTYLIMFINAAMALFVFVKRVRTVGKAAAKGLEVQQQRKDSGRVSTDTNKPVSSAETRSNLEEIALEARNAGGGAVAVFLTNYVLTIVGIGMGTSDSIMLFVFMVNISTIFIMSFVLAYFTRRVWTIDPNSRLRAFYSVFGSENQPRSSQDDVQSLQKQQQQQQQQLSPKPSLNSAVDVRALVPEHSSANASEGNCGNQSSAQV